MTNLNDKFSQKDISKSKINCEGVYLESIESKIDLYKDKQMFEMGESISLHKKGKITLHEARQKNRQHSKNLAMAENLFSNWREIDPYEVSDQKIRNLNLGYESNRL